VQHRARAYATLTGVQTAVRFVAVLGALLLAGDKLAAVLWSYAATLFLFGLLSLFYLWRDAEVRIRCEKIHIMALLRYGLPLVPHRVAGWLMGMADRIVITRFAGLAEMGVYSLGYSLGATVGMVQDALNRAWVPFFFEWLKRGDAHSRNRIAQFILLYSVAVLLVAALVTVTAPVLFPLFGPRFAAARVFVIFIAFSSALNGIYKMAGNFLFFTDRTYLLSSITIAVGLVSIGVNVALVSHFGVIGAGYSAVFAQALLCISVFSVARRLFTIPWRSAFLSLYTELRGRLVRI
jgi:O-antigen/teichoic acid export membrane protein